ncbi:FG-GAP-like repeat-containing protein [Taibaiella koreensis]|uniref:FG-GAP-like repeat-containing protein n=1 Tax=Taibaiella koreensis TaxID=1268548 RepID=UPI000E59D486|nr:FG-GAP-like repeat-containing protein [Taibaiella koreensis]
MPANRLKPLLGLILLLLCSCLSFAQSLLYQNNFESAGAPPYPPGPNYAYTPDVLTSHLSNSKWTLSAGSWTAYAGNSGGYALAFIGATNPTKTMDLSFDVEAQYALSISGFSFYQRSSSTGYDTWELRVNDVPVATGNIFVDVLNGSAPMQNTGNIQLSSPIENLAGTVHVSLVLKTGDPSGSRATFRFDEFKLNGSVYSAPGGGSTGTGTSPSLAAGNATDGTFNVSNVGSASYNVPIKVPKGFNGLQPNLAFEYNSNSGNGIMGMGWNLTGSSAIARVPNNIYNDKQTSGVSLSANDKFALDGNRLIVMQGNYGDPASQYRTENETFKTIVANGTLGNGPASFTVTDINGWTYQYGSGANSLMQAPGVTTPNAWLLDKVTDQSGNYMTYEYSQPGNGEVLLSKISYQANSVTGLTPQGSVVFDYINRTDPQMTFVGGGKFVSTKILNTVTCNQQSGSVGRIAHKYALNYMFDGYTHLMGITEGGKDNTETAGATQFAYGAVTAPFVETLVSDPNSSGNVFTDFSVGDYNGDGKGDLVQYTRQYDPSNNNWWLYLGVSNTFNQVQTGALPSAPPNIEENELVKYSRSYFPRFIDFNGDGKDDFIYQSTSYLQSGNPSGTFQNLNIMLSDGNALTALSPKVATPYPNSNSQTALNLMLIDNMPLAGDFDGDGKTEVLELNTYNPNNWSGPVPSDPANNNFMIGAEYLSPGTLAGNSFLVAKQLYGMPFEAAYVNNGQSKLMIIDYDGDGKDEVLSIWHDNSSNVDHAQVFRLNVTFDANNKPVIGTPAFVMSGEGSFPTLNHDIFPGDFNGDGKTDLLTYISSAGWQIAYGRGDGQWNLSVLSGPVMNKPRVAGASSYRPMLLGDFDGDGKTDIFDYTPTGASGWGNPQAPRIFYSKGNNTFTTENLNIDQSHLNYYSYGYWTGDFNGDGQTDLLSEMGPGLAEYTYVFHPKETRHQMVQIADGIGAFTKINYDMLTSPSVYDGGSINYSYPYIKRTLPLKVVSSVNLDNGIDFVGNAVNYTYKGVKINAWGKGLMGFDQVTSYEAAAQRFHNQVFTLNTTYALSLPQSENVIQVTGGSSVPVTTVNNTFGIYEYGNKRLFTYLQQTQNADLLKGTSSTVSYNYTTTPGTPGGAPASVDIGKPMSVTTDKGGGIESTTQTFHFPNMNGPVYTYANPDKVTTTANRQGQASYTRVTDYTYNPANGLLSTTVSDPGTTNAVTTQLSYNAYAAVTQKITSAGSVPTLNEITSYDPSNRFITQKYNTTYPDVSGRSAYDPVTGTAQSDKEADGLTTTYTYDGFGREKTGTKSNGAITAARYALASGFSGIAPQNARYGIQTSSNTAEPSYKFYDRLRRLVRTARPAYLGATLIYEDITYNQQGQVASKTKPYLANGSPQLISYTYDSYGRAKEQVAPEGTTQTSYTLTGGLYKVTTTTPAGQQNTTATDGSGRTASNTDNSNTTLSYTYYSHGQTKQVDLSGVGTVQQFEYDLCGRKTRQADPNYGNTGAFQYTYNAYGQVLTEKDPYGHTYSYTYDVLGNTLTKNGPEGLYTYTYSYTTGPNCGKQTSIAGPAGVLQQYDYGQGDKLNSRQLTANGQSLATLYSYDTKGRLSGITFPNSKQVVYEYGSNDGSLQLIRSALNIPLPIYYACRTKNAMGQITYETQGSDPGNTNTVATNYTYDNYNLLSEQSSVSPLASVGLKHFQYSFDPTTANLQQRKDIDYGLQEDFSYDNMNRLTGIQSNVIGLAPLNLDYSANGNIKLKTDAGMFKYNQANRLSRIDSYVDVPEITQDVTYTAFNKVAQITEDQNQAVFTYWANGERSSMKLTQGGVLQKTKYYSPDFELEVDAITGATRELCYIKGPNDNIVAILETKNGADHTYYVVSDHLGSIVQIVDESGNPVEEKSFDAWGRPRNPQTWFPLSPTYASNGWDRGYTAQEYLPQFGILNLNGRLYDPLMGRMFSPDPYIMGDGNTQGYNRYTYAMNNPLSYKDPNGEWINFVIGAVLGGISGWQIGKANGATGWDMVGYIAGGALVGLASSGVASGVSAAYAGSGALISTAISGASAGLVGGFGSSMLAGRNPVDGAWKGAVSGAVGSVAGGYIGGGLGAFTGGAVSSGLNTGLNGGDLKDIGISALTGGGTSWAVYHVAVFVSYLSSPLRGGVNYGSFARMTADGQRSPWRQREMGGLVSRTGKYYRAPAGAGAVEDHFNLDYDNRSWFPEDEDIMLAYHTHWKSNHSIVPSTTDLRAQHITNGIDGLMLNTQGEMYLYGNHRPSIVANMVNRLPFFFLYLH